MPVSAESDEGLLPLTTPPASQAPLLEKEKSYSRTPVRFGAKSFLIEDVVRLQSHAHKCSSLGKFL